MIIMLLVCVEWNKSPLLYIYKLEQLYKHLPVVVDYIHYTCCTPRWQAQGGPGLLYIQN